MAYTIGQIAKKVGLSTHTLRFYDKEGLLPFITKNASGIRIFTDEDLEWLIIIECLKGTGMTLKDIKLYLDLAKRGYETAQERVDMLVKQKEEVIKQKAILDNYLEKIEFKIAVYGDALKNGDMNVFSRNTKLRKERERLFFADV